MSFNNNNDTIESTFEIITIRSFYEQYIKSNKLLLKPEYKRDFCWSINKQKTLLYTIFNNLILPNIT
jgi:hypothetical protein